jgi:hypothetical protein
LLHEQDVQNQVGDARTLQVQDSVVAGGMAQHRAFGFVRCRNISNISNERSLLIENLI